MSDNCRIFAEHYNETMKEPKVSLVFPCWHAAQHMPHVLEDLQAQTFKEFEAILVNDGDDSQIEAMEAIAAQDSRIRIVRLEQNSGVAAARNAGTDTVTTNWVTYPDPDDRFGPNYVKSLYEAVDGTGVEMACGGITYYDVDSDNYSYIFLKIENSPMVLNFATGYELMSHSWIYSIVWNKLYNIDLIRKNGLYHDVNFKNNQDVDFNLRYFPFVKTVSLIYDCEYVYYWYTDISNYKRYNPLLMQNKLDNIYRRAQLHRQLGWTEERINKIKEHEFVSASLRICKNLYAIDSPLSVDEATTKIQAELFDQPEIVNAVLKYDFGKDRFWQLFQWLVRKGNARLLAIVFKVLVVGKRHFNKLYQITKPFFR